MTSPDAAGYYIATDIDVASVNKHATALLDEADTLDIHTAPEAAACSKQQHAVL